MSFVTRLYTQVLVPLFFEWFDIKSVALIDVALTTSSKLHIYEAFNRLKGNHGIVQSVYFNVSDFNWVCNRCIRLTNLNLLNWEISSHNSAGAM